MVLRGPVVHRGGGGGWVDYKQPYKQPYGTTKDHQSPLPRQNQSSPEAAAADWGYGVAMQ